MRKWVLEIENALEMHIKSREEVLKAVRKIPKGRISSTGVFASHKNNAGVHYESGLEHDFATILEFNSGVKRFVEQPVKIEFTNDNGKKRSYTPDFLAYYRTDRKEYAALPPHLFEVKTRSQLKKKWGELRPKFKEAIKFSVKKGWKFKIITEKEIYSNYFLNARFLLPYMRLNIDSGLIENIMDAMDELDITTPSEVLAFATTNTDRKAQLVPALWYLIGQRVIGCDLNCRLTMETEIWVTRDY